MTCLAHSEHGSPLPPIAGDGNGGLGMYDDRECMMIESCPGCFRLRRAVHKSLSLLPPAEVP